MNGKQQHHQEENQKQKPIHRQAERQHTLAPGNLTAGSQVQPGLMRLPLGQGTRPQRQAHLLQLQRQHGNAAVMRLLQRQDEGGTTEPAAAPTEINAGGNLVRVTDGGVEITGASVSINAATLNANTAFSRFSGVLQTDTLIANSVMGQSYTPGAGNIW